ncbi:hypothetical protein VTI28DRAFT_767 [Corynascus sepedonium]
MNTTSDPNPRSHLFLTPFSHSHFGHSHERHKPLEPPLQCMHHHPSSCGLQLHLRMEQAKLCHPDQQAAGENEKDRHN